MGERIIRRSKLDWDHYYLEIAEVVAKRSKDPSTGVGAVIVVNRVVGSTGYNGFPRGVRDYEDRWERPQKYSYVVHAEMNAILSADLTAVRNDPESCVYVTHRPCSDCVKAIIQCGLKGIVTANRLVVSHSEMGIRIGNEMLKEADIWIREV
jgi:dCMP deaminase